MHTQKKCYSFAKNVTICTKFTENVAVFVSKIVSQFQKDSSSLDKVIVAFFKHTEFCNSQTMLFDIGVRNKKIIKIMTSNRLQELFYFLMMQSELLTIFSLAKQHLLRVLCKNVEFSPLVSMGYCVFKMTVLIILSKSMLNQKCFFTVSCPSVMSLKPLLE